MNIQTLRGRLTLPLLTLMACAACHAADKVNVCVQEIKAYGEHVRFSSEDHIAVLLRSRNEKAEWAYRLWEDASREITSNWFTGKETVEVSYLKSHMPRAIVFVSRFPASKSTLIDKKRLEELLSTEAAYEKAEDREGSQIFYDNLMAKYKIGPSATFDKDMGGATPMGSCGKYEEREWPETGGKKQ